MSEQDALIAAAKKVAARLPELSPEKRARVAMLLGGESGWHEISEPVMAATKLPALPTAPPAVETQKAKARWSEWPDCAGVYFVQSGDAIKIGTSINVRRRLVSLQTPYPPILLAVAAGGRTEEQELHRTFRHLHIHGEWFRAEPELLDYIASLDPKPTPSTPA